MESNGRLCPEKEEEIWEVLNELEGPEKGRAYYELSNFAFGRGQFHRSLALAEMARDLFVDLGQCYEGLANSQAIVATSFDALKEHARAIDEMKRAIEYFVEYSVQGERDMRRRLITWLYNEERIEEAFSYITENIEYAIYEGQDYECAIEYSKYADGLCEIGKDALAIEKYKLARDKFKASRDVEKVADMDFMIGRCFIHIKEPVEAEFHLNRALAIYESATLDDDIAKTRSQLGRSAVLQKKYEEALGHFEVSRKIVLAEEELNYYALYSIQKNMVEAMRGVGWDVEADVIERRNAVINEVLEWGKNEAKG
jgi:tetratricopeptide (TPR) repeat protein